MARLITQDRGKILDVLAERLYVERAAIKLYDWILAHLSGSGEPILRAMVPQMEVFREDEREHVDYLGRCIRHLGGDAERITVRAGLAAREVAGIEEIAKRDPDLLHLFHALLVAELVDTAGWDLLASLAEDAGDPVAKKDFQERLAQERRHTAFARNTVRMLAARDILGEPLRNPALREVEFQLP